MPRGEATFKLLLERDLYMPEQNEILDDQSAQDLTDYIRTQLSDDENSEGYYVEKRIYPKPLVSVMRALAAKTVMLQKQFLVSCPSMLDETQVLLLPDPTYFAWSIKFADEFSQEDLKLIKNKTDIVVNQKFTESRALRWMIVRLYLLNCENDIVPLTPFGLNAVLTAFPLSPRFVRSIVQWHRKVAKSGDYTQVKATQDGQPVLAWQFGGHTLYDRPYFPALFYRLFNDKFARGAISFFQDMQFHWTKSMCAAFLGNKKTMEVSMADFVCETEYYLNSRFSGLYISILPGANEPDRSGGVIQLDQLPEV